MRVLAIFLLSICSVMTFFSTVRAQTSVQNWDASGRPLFRTTRRIFISVRVRELPPGFISTPMTGSEDFSLDSIRQQIAVFRQ